MTRSYKNGVFFFHILYSSLIIRSSAASSKSTIHVEAAQEGKRYKWEGCVCDHVHKQPDCPQVNILDSCEVPAPDMFHCYAAFNGSELERVLVRLQWVASNLHAVCAKFAAKPTNQKIERARTSVFFRYTADMATYMVNGEKHFAIAVGKRTKLPVRGLHILKMLLSVF